ncbi:DUF3426 domain-containing protein [Pseudomonas sp. UBA2684]|uniref:DUF3426 domain-containing protein n=1 Tax=Pseudomonas sp. UBA2684 TaxID=1947311 RepID=UPI000E8A2B57|nr:DUF3426 domain-containing protein [Pseudomonas sp. UBA2684]HBX57286.1 DUF3426 domain-containing protein [Pseudomonas sp.]|tara:strand:- start:5086 stop:6414 length:1329 start_codon:yes stop_codon:yes gene_type:complete
MTESFVTQCPHCRTSFRVNRAQLGAAHGAVRCGACLHVFNAAQQLLEQGQTLTAAARATPLPTPTPPVTARPDSGQVAAQPAKSALAQSTPPGKNPSDTLWIHDDLDLDGLDLDEELAKLEQQEQQLSQQFLALERAPKYAEDFRATPQTEHSAHDEQWAEALLRDEAPAAPLSLSPVTPRETPAAPTAPSNPLPVTTATTSQSPRSEPTFDLHDAEPDEPGLTLSAERDDAAPEPEPREGDDRPETLQLTPHERSEPGLRDEHLFDLDEEPLQLDWQTPQKPWGRWLGWGLLNLIGAAALAGQYIHYHFDELARQDQYRPWFEQLCPTIGCTLPSKVDIAQIKSSNLVVRSHPQFSGALVVDAILYNRAPFAQPFPLLEMRFADINGQLLASRRFKPSEYLAGELAGQAEMPPQTPIHISLDILDPGTQAVNYSLSFHSPE